tara:strand:+ start:1179 stop:1496 length:318 start_codon:yes stop_codon:yes gene_type:complete
MEIINASQIFQLIFALAFVVLLMAALAQIIKRLGLGNATPVNKSQKRLKIIESQALDARRRVVIIQCDDKQHLVMLGINSETVIKTDIKSVKDPNEEPKKQSAKH